MNKQFLYTSIGVALSFVIAIGGWALTSALIDKKSDSILSATGVVTINAPPTPSENNPIAVEENKERPGLTEDEILSVLKNWESFNREQPHEPVEGQISMEQAISAGRDGINYFHELGIIPNSLSEYIKVNAYLCRNQTNEDKSQPLEPFYSYWTVSFADENIKIVLTINAVTGQIWKANITLPRSDATLSNTLVKDALNAFTAYLELNNDEKINLLYEQNEISGFLNSPNNMYCVVVKMKGETSDTITTSTEISIYLTSEEMALE